MLPLLERLRAALRRVGLETGPAQALEAAEALLIIDFMDRAQAHAALRSVLCRRVEEFQPFDLAFDSVWDGRLIMDAAGTDEESSGVIQSGDAAEELPPLSVEEAAPQPEQSGPSYSSEVILTRDIGQLKPEEEPQLARLVRLLVRRLAMQLARRQRRSRRGHIDPSATLRRALRSGGEVIQFRRRRRRREKARIVSILDVSGSMQPYARAFLQLLSGLQGRVPYMETFTFSTYLTRVTRDLRSRDLTRVARAAADWAGGTRIGANLQLFVAHFGARLVNRQTTVIILSDGLDVGELDVLEGAMKALRHRAGRVIWLNPLAGSPGYEPLTRGMRTAMPYVDELAAAHSLESLFQAGLRIGGGWGESGAGRRDALRSAVYRRREGGHGRPPGSAAGQAAAH